MYLKVNAQWCRFNNSTMINQQKIKFHGTDNKFLLFICRITREGVF